MNSIISAVKEQRTGICSALVSAESGLREADDKPSVLIIYDVIAPLPFRTVRDLHGNTVTSLVWGQWCPLLHKARAPHRWPFSGSSLRQLHWWKDSTTALTITPHLVLVEVPARGVCLIPKGYTHTHTPARALVLSVVILRRDRSLRGGA